MNELVNDTIKASLGEEDEINNVRTVTVSKKLNETKVLDYKAAI